MCNRADETKRESELYKIIRVIARCMHEEPLDEQGTMNSTLLVFTSERLLIPILSPLTSFPITFCEYKTRT